MARKPPLTIAAIVEAPQSISHRKLTAEQVQQVLHRLESVEGFVSAFAREAMRHAPPGELEAHWARTSEALSKAGRQYSLGDAAFRQTLALMQTPWLLAACQAGAIAGPSPRVIAAALAKDGSEASHDALLAEFERARRDSREWDLRYKLKKIARYAKQNEAWRNLERAVHGEIASRDEAAAGVPTIAARQLGLEIPLLKWSAQVRGSRGTSLWVSIDDRHGRAQLDYLRPDGSREPELRDVTTLPTRLATIVHRDRVRFDWAQARLRTNLRGKKRDAFMQWVQGLRASPLPG